MLYYFLKDFIGLKESFLGSRSGRTQDTQFNLCLLNLNEWYLDLNFHFYPKIRFNFTELTKVDDLIVRVWIQIKHKTKSRWYPLMIMNRNRGKYKKMSVTAKIDSPSYFQKCLPEGLTSCSPMEPLGSTIIFHIQFLCLVVWHLQILYLTMHLYLNTFKPCTQNPDSEHWMNVSVAARRYFWRKTSNKKFFKCYFLINAHIKYVPMYDLK